MRHAPDSCNSLLGPLIIAVEGRSIFTLGARGIAGERHPAGVTLTGADSVGRGGLFAHVDVARLDPDGVVDDAVHDRVGVDSGAEALVPVLLRVLGAEHCRCRVVAAFEELEQHAADVVGGRVE